jgi:hypothetical protein
MFKTFEFAAVVVGVIFMGLGSHGAAAQDTSVEDVKAAFDMANVSNHPSLSPFLTLSLFPMSSSTALIFKRCVCLMKLYD